MENLQNLANWKEAKNSKDENLDIYGLKSMTFLSNIVDILTYRTRNRNDFWTNLMILLYIE